jgi:nitroreductase
MMEMDFRELIIKRRSIREFDGKAVSPALVGEIIADCIQAPNARNAQPWSFIVVANSGMIKKLSDESKKNILWDMGDNPSSPYTMYKPILENVDFNVFYNAPCVVYITGPRDVRSLAVDCALAAAYFMLSAADRGLGTCWVDLGSVIRDAGLRNELGLSKDYAIASTIALGYPARIPGTPPRSEPRILKIIE